MKPFNVLNFATFKPKNVLIMFLKNLYAKAFDPDNLLIIVFYSCKDNFLAGKKNNAIVIPICYCYAIVIVIHY